MYDIFYTFGRNSFPPLLWIISFLQNCWSNFVFKTVRIPGVCLLLSYDHLPWPKIIFGWKGTVMCLGKGDCSLQCNSGRSLENALLVSNYLQNIPNTVVLRKCYWLALATWIWNRFSISLSGVSWSGFLILMMFMSDWMKSLAHYLDLGDLRLETFCCNLVLHVFNFFFNVTSELPVNLNSVKIYRRWHRGQALGLA